MCPHCGKSVLCSCVSCTARRNNGESITPEDLLVEVMIDKETGIFECPYCKKQYSYDESDECVWNLFIQTDEYKSQTNNGTYN